MSSATKNDNKIPPVGGFFLTRRQLFRGTAILVTLILSILSADKVSINVVKSMERSKWNIHLFAFSCFYGCSMWVTFVAGLVMFNNLPRHTFGKIQSKLFPKYFQYSILFIGICLSMEASVLVRSRLLKDIVSEPSHLLLPSVQLLNITVIMVTLLWNLRLEPVTTKVMFKRHVVERKIGTGHEVGVTKPAQSILDAADEKDVEDFKSLSKEFGKLHGISASLNLVTLLLGTWHLCWLGSRICSD